MSSQLHPLGYESQTAHLSTGHFYRYVDVHPPPGVNTIATALLLHGFPDSAYGWRHQVKGWSSRGIRLIIPDALGYTGSSQPLDPEEYSYKRQSDDYEALIRHIGIPESEKIVLISHDWGAVTAIRLSQLKPDLVKGVASLGVPFAFAKPAKQYIPTETFVEMLPNFEYWLFFGAPESGPLLDANVDKFISVMFITAKQFESGEFPLLVKKGALEGWLKDNTTSTNPGLLTQQEFDTIVAQIKAGAGFSAMLNYYKTRKINFELEKTLPENYRPEMPKLLVIPVRDIALPAELSANAEKEFENIEVVRFEGLCGHWVQLEMAAEVEKIVGEWVERMAAKGWLHPLGYESKTANLSTGHHYRYVDVHPPQGVKTIVTALLLHGFPDSAYGWRHQVKGWSSRGIRLIIPAALGYTGSSQPTDPEEYSFKRQSDDYEALIEHIGLPEDEKIILIAHDWGAGIANRMAQFKPNLVKGVAKQFESGEVPSFEKKGVIESWLKDDTKSVHPALLTKEEFVTMVGEIKAGIGFAAMLNYYRTRKFNFELEKDLPQEYRPEMPKLLVVPNADPAIPVHISANIEKAFQNIEVVRLEGSCGHWVQLERPAEIEKEANWGDQ
ncbi:hypothetical protein FRC06_003839 [Ceratobasidium sp. 370]|nr:hypothetical protein FRC06_003839 [Ceratobasidium sp. 370]